MKIQDLAQIQVTSKALISSNIDAIVQGIEAGEIDPLEMQALAGILSEAAKQLKEASKSYAVDEASQYGKGEKITKLGCSLSASNSSTYSYQGKVYEELKEKEAQVKAELKAYTDQAKLLNKQNKALGWLVDDETGEQIEVLPAIVDTTSTIKVSIPKS